MKAYQVIDDFKARTDGGVMLFKKGQVIDAHEEKADPLVRLGKLTPYQEVAGPVCPACHERAFWESVYGALRCGVCSPPASVSLVSRWLGDSGALARLKTARPAVVLSWEECRRRKNEQHAERQI